MPSLRMGLPHLPVLARSLSSTEDTFTSWDKCMSKAYCKWPVIVAIIVVAVILIAVVGCIVNCICCGYRICACCCGCCCPSGRRKNKSPRNKHFDDPPFYNHHSEPPPQSYNQPSYNQTPYNQQPSIPAPPSYRGAVQTATFDTSKSAAKSTASNVNEDALPEMPTWASATDKHVEDTNVHEDVEMEPLNPQGHAPDRKYGAGTPMHSNTYADYSSDRIAGAVAAGAAGAAAGYRGFNPTDPYARRSPAPAATLAATQDPYGRRSPAMPSPAAAAAIDPYARRSPAPAAAMDPYGRRSPGPAAAFAAAQDPYGRRSPGPNNAFAPAQDPYAPHSPVLASPMGAVGAATAVSSYDHQPYDQHQAYDQHQTYDQHQPYDHAQPYEDYSPGAANPMINTTGTGYTPHTLTSPSPVAAYQPQTGYNAFSPTAETAHHDVGFTRQPSFGSSQYPPTYTSQPPYRIASPSLPASPPPPFQAPSPHDMMGHEYGHAAPIGMAMSEPVGHAVSSNEPSRDRPPTLLMSGRQPATNF
ncbi:uncharacterized protein N7483_008756 [Penicillium malachiteum]|uniref:uncharacterized protein n=1 Tax=Penicillium malachiteum TaxID=1324776 RepID=UPI0025493330|nr:uncharacterized protein N7483_008756 [Penicillium malachiteum]KAJ5720822.1 hypothetical protein N7483_008756 [Penicillium malachiteum]